MKMGKRQGGQEVEEEEEREGGRGGGGRRGRSRMTKRKVGKWPMESMKKALGHKAEGEKSGYGYILRWTFHSMYFLDVRGWLWVPGVVIDNCSRFMIYYRFGATVGYVS